MGKMGTSTNVLTKQNISHASYTWKEWTLKLIRHLPCYQISRIYYSLICLKILFYSANKNAAFYPNKIAPHVYPCNFSGQGHCCDYENHTRCIDNPNRPVWMKNDKVKNMTELNIVQVFIIGPWLSTNSARVYLRNFWNLTQLQNIWRLGTPKMCQSKDV